MVNDYGKYSPVTFHVLRGKCFAGNLLSEQWSLIPNHVKICCGRAKVRNVF